MADNRLAREVPAGTIITAGMVERPKDSLLWSLRRAMEEAFGLH